MKRYLFVLAVILLLLCYNNLSFSQINQPLLFPYLAPDSTNTKSSITGLPNGDIMFFWIFEADIFSSRSTDNGLTWSQPQYLFNTNNSLNIPEYVSSIVTSSGRILLAFKKDLYPLITFSDDNGITWSEPDTLLTSFGPFTIRFLEGHGLTLSDDGKIYFTYGRVSTDGVYYNVSSNNGSTWSNSQVSTYGFGGSIISLNPDQDIIVYQDLVNDKYQLISRITTDSGATWSSPSVFLVSDYNDTHPKFIKDSNDTIWLFFNRQEETPFNDFHQEDIKYIISTDSGLTWTAPESFTKYRGQDLNCDVNLWNNQPLVSFSSSRNSQIVENLQFFYGIAGITEDNNAPPVIYLTQQFPEEPHSFEDIIIRCFADDENAVESVKLIYSLNDNDPDTLIMLDNGFSDDSLANDKIFGIKINGLEKGTMFTYSFLVMDIDSNSAFLFGRTFFIPLDYNIDAYRFEVNRFKVPFSNHGIIASVSINGISGGWYDESSVLFSGGFYLSGRNVNNIWATGMASASRIQDYQPGIVNSLPDDPKNQLYVIKSSDTSFGESWQNYKFAVQLGANFYDGNNNNIYDPVDINGNGNWDLDEDRPDLLGDVTAWCVYNDGVPSNLRQYQDQVPLGVEIKQTVFAIGDNITGPIESMVFIRYAIENTGTVTQEIDSVYFGIWSDTDIGGSTGYTDDLVGCDTLLNSGYAYNDGDDSEYGINPPSIFLTLLQGPAVYIPGETFLDNNSNGIYDDSIDISLDTAFINNGLFIGSNILPGAKNLCISSFTHYIASHPTQGDPGTSIEARNYMLGTNKFGIPYDPCTWEFGEIVGGIPCNTINPLFMYSGDPVTNIGWLNVTQDDQRIMVTTGPFKLNENEPVEIWAGYIVGRGNDHLNSVTKAREYSDYAYKYYKSNFATLPLGVDPENTIVNNFVLHQNYPNPFNPVTTIKYQIPGTGKILLRVYDILGQEVKTLINTEQNAGVYEINFDASSLSSGIYFYELRTEEFSSVKKMILLK